MLKGSDLRELSEDQLKHKLAELKEQFFKLRFQAKTGQVSNPLKKRELRRDIARILTILNQKKPGGKYGIR